MLDGYDINAAVQAARRASIAIVMVGEKGEEGRDHSIELTPEENNLVEAVAKVQPKTIVVLKTGSAVIMPWIDDVPAVLKAWYPGEESGNAVADVLFGKVNPSGKLPLTFPKRVEDTLAGKPDQYPGDATTVHYSEALEVGYRGYQADHVEPLFPFGFGLSYTTFSFSDLKAVSTGEGHAKVTFLDVPTPGSREGAEVAQLYLDYPPIAEGDPAPAPVEGLPQDHAQTGRIANRAARIGPPLLLVLVREQPFLEACSRKLWDLRRRFLCQHAAHRHLGRSNNRLIGLSGEKEL